MYDETIIPWLNSTRSTKEKGLHLTNTGQSKHGKAGPDGHSRRLRWHRAVLEQSMCKGSIAYFDSVHGAGLHGALCISSATGFRQF